MFMRMRALRLLGLVVALSLIFAVAASAAWVELRNKTGVLTGDLGTLTLFSKVEQDGSLYRYSYNLTYDVGAGGNVVTRAFAVENPDDLSYSNADNSKDFINPTYVDEEDAYEMKWYGGTLGVGQYADFSYTSIYAPRDIDVFAYGEGDVDFAWGENVAIGQAMPIPEPSSLAGIALAVAGFAPKILRRRR